jgi:phage-related holin
MKASLLTLMTTLTTLCAFIGTYFLNLTANNSEQYLAVVAIVFIDGFFGVIAGTKLEGFQTKKAIKVLQTLVVWVFLLTGILMIEKGFEGTLWLSETICAPFILFQLVSALKNAARAGLIKNELLTAILEKIDKHKINEKL